MKKLLSMGLALLLFITTLCMPDVCAEGDPNIDHGGGGWGDGSDMNKWEMFDEGIRATVIDAVSGDPVSASVDLSNMDASDIQIHFGKVSKSAYRNGTELARALSTTPNYLLGFENGMKSETDQMDDTIIALLENIKDEKVRKMLLAQIYVVSQMEE